MGALGVRGRRARRRADRDVDDDAIWRGEVADADVVMTAAERFRIEERRRVERRRRIVDVFGEPVGSTAIADGTVRHRRRGEHGSVPLDQNRSAGCREEIQVTMLVHPSVATELICDGALLATADRLVVDASSERRSSNQLTWDVEVRTRPWSSRRSRLRLYGSPSSNVTVMTLTPVRSRRRGARRFVTVGLATLTGMGDAVERGAAADGGRHSART